MQTGRTQPGYENGRQTKPRAVLLWGSPRRLRNLLRKLLQLLALHRLLRDRKRTLAHLGRLFASPQLQQHLSRAGSCLRGSRAHALAFMQQDPMTTERARCQMPLVAKCPRPSYDPRRPRAMDLRQLAEGRHQARRGAAPPLLGQLDRLPQMRLRLWRRGGATRHRSRTRSHADRPRRFGSRVDAAAHLVWLPKLRVHLGSPQ